jgi:2-methylcitrate dehydratase PrpD
VTPPLPVPTSTCPPTFRSSTAGEKEYTDEAARDPQVIALRERVSVSVDPAIRTDEAYVTITTTGGQTFTKHVEHAVGSVKNLLTDNDFPFKFTQLASGILPPARKAPHLRLEPPRAKQRGRPAAPRNPRLTPFTPLRER